MNILFCVNPNSHLIYYKLAEQLKEQGEVSRAHFLSIYPKETWRKTPIGSGCQKIIFSEDIEHSVDKDYLVHLDNKFEDFSLGRIYAAEKRPHLYLRHGYLDVENMARFQKAALQLIRPDLVISAFPACAFGLLMHFVMLDFGIRFLYIDGERIPGRFFLWESIDDRSSKIITIYKNANKWNLPQECWDTAGRIAQEWIGKTKNIKGQASHIQLKKITLKEHLRSFLKNDYRSWQIRNRKNLDRNFHDVFTQPDFNARYIYFPLQKQPESSTYVWAVLQKNQYDMLYKLALALPPDYLLYVKESFSNFGNHNCEFYLNIMRSMPNVRFIDPRLSSLDMISHSQCTVTVTGSAALEAHLMGKRAIVVADTTYLHYFDEIHLFKNEMTDFVSLKTLVKDVLAKEEGTLSWEERIKAVFAIYYGSFCGYMDDQFFEPEVLKQENIRKVTKGIINYLNQRQPQGEEKFYYDGDHISC